MRAYTHAFSPKFLVMGDWLATSSELGRVPVIHKQCLRFPIARHVTLYRIKLSGASELVEYAILAPVLILSYATQGSIVITVSTAALTAGDFVTGPTSSYRCGQMISLLEA